MFSQLTSDTTAHEHFSIVSMVGDAEMESHSHLKKEENEVMLGNQDLPALVPSWMSVPWIIFPGEPNGNVTTASRINNLNFEVV